MKNIACLEVKEAQTKGLECHMNVREVKCVIAAVNAKLAEMMCQEFGINSGCNLAVSQIDFEEDVGKKTVVQAGQGECKILFFGRAVDAKLAANLTKNFVLPLGGGGASPTLFLDGSLAQNCNRSDWSTAWSIPKLPEKKMVKKKPKTQQREIAATHRIEFDKLEGDGAGAILRVRDPDAR